MTGPKKDRTSTPEQTRNKSFFIVYSSSLTHNSTQHIPLPELCCEPLLVGTLESIVPVVVISSRSRT